ncbi:MAG: hypothetical protein RBU29_05775 [bacterium]|jgi:hypothetical protein|nr:hypothetical protein [bacterium]
MKTTYFRIFTGLFLCFCLNLVAAENDGRLEINAIDPNPIDDIKIQIIKIPALESIAPALLSAQPDVLYEQDFNTTTPPYGWFTSGGYWNLTGTALRGRNSSTLNFCYFKPGIFSTAVYSSQLNFNNTTCPMGICYRFRYEFSNGAYRSNGYGVGIYNQSGKIQYILGKWVNNTWIDITPDWIMTNITSQTWNTLSIRVVGYQHQITINGTLVGTYNDGTFPNGHVGVWKQNWQNSIYADFDNVKVVEIIQATPTPTRTPTHTPTPQGRPTPTPRPKFTPTPTPQGKATPTPSITPTPVVIPTACIPIGSTSPIYENRFEGNDFNANGMMEIPGTFGNLTPASTSLTSIVPSQTNNQGGEGNAIRFIAQAGEGSTFILGTDAAIPANGLIYLKADVWSSTANAQLFFGVIDTSATGDIAAGKGSLGLEQHFDLSQYTNTWHPIQSSHLSTTGYVKPIFQVVGAEANTEIYIDNLELYIIPWGTGICDCILW